MFVVFVIFRLKSKMLTWKQTPLFLQMPRKTTKANINFPTTTTIRTKHANFHTMDVSTHWQKTRMKMTTMKFFSVIFEKSNVLKEIAHMGTFLFPRFWPTVTKITKPWKLSTLTIKRLLHSPSSMIFQLRTWSKILTGPQNTFLFMKNTFILR